MKDGPTVVAASVLVAGLLLLVVLLVLGLVFVLDPVP